MDPIGVAHILDALDAGGAERVAINLVNHIPQEQFRPYLCTTRRDGPMASLICPSVKRECFQRRSLLDLGAILRMIRFLRREKIRVVHAHGSCVIFCAAALSMCKDVRLIWHIHYGRLADDDKNPWHYRAVAKRVDRAIGVSQNLVEWAHRRLGIPQENVIYVPNPVVANTMSNQAASLPGTGGSRIVCVANIRPEKDHLTLLRAMVEIAQSRPAAHLLLAGKAASEELGARLVREIEELGLRDRVSWLGPLQDVGPVLNACDIAVLSSRTEGLPMALLEYGAAGLPTVATDVGYCSEVLDGGKAGLLVPPGEPQALAAALTKLIDSQELRETFGSALRERTHARFSPVVVMEQVCRLYNEVLAK